LSLKLTTQQANALLMYRNGLDYLIFSLNDGHEMLKIETDTHDLDLESLVASLSVYAAKLAPGKREHFIHVMRTLMDCYQSDAKQGIVLLRDGASESETMMLVAINADPFHVDDLIDTLCNLRGMSMAASAGTAIN
jgi:hypothetical protein